MPQKPQTADEIYHTLQEDLASFERQGFTPRGDNLTEAEIDDEVINKLYPSDEITDETEAESTD